MVERRDSTPIFHSEKNVLLVVTSDIWFFSNKNFASNIFFKGAKMHLQNICQTFIDRVKMIFIIEDQNKFVW